MWKLKLVLQGCQKKHVRIAISQKGLVNFFLFRICSSNQSIFQSCSRTSVTFYGHIFFTQNCTVCSGSISDAFVDIVTITIKAIVVELLDHDSDLCDHLWQDMTRLHKAVINIWAIIIELFVLNIDQCDQVWTHVTSLYL